MRFNEPKALRYLLQNNIVATLRATKYNLGQYIYITIRKQGFTKKIGVGQIIDVYKATEENIKKLYHLSGFNSPEEWLEAFRRIYKKRKIEPKYIYVVKLLKKFI